MRPDAGPEASVVALAANGEVKKKKKKRRSRIRPRSHRRARLVDPTGRRSAR
jgi:hypothetical protein